MPRGIPNAKRDDMGMRYTTFQVPVLPNPKNTASHYLKSEFNTLWYHNTHKAGRSKLAEDLVPPAPEGRRGSKVIVIHPGSRWLRIGKASDVAPVSVPHVIARKLKPPVPPLVFVEGIQRPRKGKEKALPAGTKKGDEYSVVVSSDDPVEGKIATIATSLRDRMRFYKLRVVANASRTAMAFNEHLEGEPVADNDSMHIDWLYKSPDDDILIGQKALTLSDPQKLGYVLKRPIHGSRFNTRDYSSHQNILNDLEVIWRTVIEKNLDIEAATFQDYSVVLVIPDLWDRFYVHDLVKMLLVDMGFKQIVCQQESLAATYGAGISNACVIDMGAVKTTVACVDDGLVVSDTRMSLNVGGDDITEFLYVLLDRISFPYKDVNLARTYDWAVLEDIKSRICTLFETDVALNLYDFVVRRPGKRAEKFGLRAYDEVILAPMCIFEPKVIDFEQKHIGISPATDPDVTDEILEYVNDRLTHAMLISTQHLMPQAQSHVAQPSPAPPATIPSSLSGTATPLATDIQVTQEARLSEEKTDKIDTEGDGKEKVDDPTTSEDASKKSESHADTMDIDVEMIDEKAIVSESQTPRVASASEGPSQLPESETATARQQTPEQRNPSVSATVSQPVPVQNQTSYLGSLPIDVVFESSKLPLDVAIFNSARAAGGDDKIRKYLQAVLVVGGTALIPGMAHALESRLQAIATPLVPNMEKVQIIPPPKDVDPRLLVWKGAAVLGKMEGVSDLWLTSADWQILGMRGLKERCYFL